MALKDYCFDGKRQLKLKEMPTDAGEYKVQKSDLVALTEANMTQAAMLQEKLYAAKRERLVFALQARDAAGKDSLIKKVFISSLLSTFRVVSSAYLRLLIFLLAVAARVDSLNLPLEAIVRVFSPRSRKGS